MLHAIRNGKSGHNIRDKEQLIPWRQLFKGSEDSLTSSIFERLFYLPEKIFWTILRESVNQKDVFTPISEKIQEYEFWPHWKASESTNSHFVEPDVFISTEEFDLIVEAKRKGAGQDKSQWKNEVVSYKTTISENKKVYFLALEGNWNVTNEEIEGIPVLKCNWQAILDAVDYLIKYFDETSEMPHQRVLLDIITAFEIHGYLKCQWLEEINPVNTYESFNNNLKILSEWKIN